MSIWRNILAALAATTLVATVGGCGLGSVPGPGPDPDPEPAQPDAGVPDNNDNVTAERQMFEDTVQPILEAKCAGSACHSGSMGEAPSKFLGDGSMSVYESTVAYPSVTGNFQPTIAGLLTKIADGHNATYSDDEQSAIQSWLLAEAKVRNPEDQGPVASSDPMARFSGCMTLTDWQESQMGDWDNKPSSEGPCDTCHNDGLARLNTNTNNDTMFEMNRYELYLIGFFTVQVDPDGTETVVPAYDKLMRMGSGNFHPNYNTDLNDQYFQYLEDFYQRTMNNMANGNCPETGYPQPTN